MNKEKNMRFYRYELAFCEEAQGVGFLQGLEDVGLPAKKYEQLFGQFASLPCPTLCDADGPVMFFFTEAGLKEYAPAINAIGQAIRRRDWNLLGMVLEEENFEHAVYHDEMQAAWLRSYLEPMSNYYNVKKAEELRSLPSNI